MTTPTPSSSEITKYDQLYGMLNALREDYTKQIDTLRSEGAKAVLEERKVTKKQIENIEKISNTNIADANTKISFFSNKLDLADRKIDELTKETEKLQAAVQASHETSYSLVTDIQIERGLEKIDKERESERSALAAKVISFSISIGLAAGGTILGAAATPFLFEVGIPVMTVCGASIAVQAPVLAKFDQEWRAIKKLPSAAEQQKIAEFKMFGTLDLTADQRKEVFAFVELQESERSAISRERVRQAEVESEKFMQSFSRPTATPTPEDQTDPLETTEMLDRPIN